MLSPLPMPLLFTKPPCSSTNSTSSTTTVATPSPSAPLPRTGTLFPQSHPPPIRNALEGPLPLPLPLPIHQLRGLPPNRPPLQSSQTPPLPAITTLGILQNKPIGSKPQPSLTTLPLIALAPPPPPTRHPTSSSPSVSNQHILLKPPPSLSNTSISNSIASSTSSSVSTSRSSTFLTPKLPKLPTNNNNNNNNTNRSLTNTRLKQLPHSTTSNTSTSPNNLTLKPPSSGVGGVGVRIRTTPSPPSPPPPPPPPPSQNGVASGLLFPPLSSSSSSVSATLMVQQPTLNSCQSIALQSLLSQTVPETTSTTAPAFSSSSLRPINLKNGPRTRSTTQQLRKMLNGGGLRGSGRGGGSSRRFTSSTTSTSTSSNPYQPSLPNPVNPGPPPSGRPPSGRPPSGPPPSGPPPPSLYNQLLSRKRPREDFPLKVPFFKPNVKLKSSFLNCPSHSSSKPDSSRLSSSYSVRLRQQPQRSNPPRLRSSRKFPGTRYPPTGSGSGSAAHSVGVRKISAPRPRRHLRSRTPTPPSDTSTTEYISSGYQMQCVFKPPEWVNERPIQVPEYRKVIGRSRNLPSQDDWTEDEDTSDKAYFIRHYQAEARETKYYQAVFQRRQKSAQRVRQPRGGPQDMTRSQSVPPKPSQYDSAPISSQYVPPPSKIPSYIGAPLRFNYTTTAGSDNGWKRPVYLIKTFPQMPTRSDEEQERYLRRSISKHTTFKSDRQISYSPASSPSSSASSSRYPLSSSSSHSSSQPIVGSSSVSVGSSSSVGGSSVGSFGQRVQKPPKTRLKTRMRSKQKPQGLPAAADGSSSSYGVSPFVGTRSLSVPSSSSSSVRLVNKRSSVNSGSTVSSGSQEKRKLRRNTVSKRYIRRIDLNVDQNLDDARNKGVT